MTLNGVPSSFRVVIIIKGGIICGFSPLVTRGEIDFNPGQGGWDFFVLYAKFNPSKEG